MKLTQTVGPTVEPILLADARAWLAFESGVNDDDPILSDLITKVRSYIERRTNIKLITQTWTASLDYDEILDEIYLPLIPLQSISSIVTYDDDGDSTTVDSSNYSVRIGDHPRLVLSPSGSWPGDMRIYDAMLITAVCGYGTAGSDLPQDLVSLVEGLVLHSYSTKGMGVRETVSGQLISIPRDFERAIKAYRAYPI